MMEENFVAFIDVLGFAEMVAKDCASPSQDYSALRKLTDVMASIEGVVGERKGVGFTQFSDSIVLYAPFKREEFDEFLTLCQTLQKLLFAKNVLCRGGIAVGRHFSDKNFIFSEGLIDAYRIESRTARVPRIIVSRNLLSLVAYPSSNYQTALLILDKDNEYFIDYLTDVSSEDIETFSLNMAAVLSKNTSISVREKYLWTASYIKFLHPHLELQIPDFARSG